MPLARVKDFVSQYDDLQIILFDTSTHTSELAAETLGVAVGQIAKSLVFLADGEPVVVVTCGDKKVNTKQLARQIGCKKLKFADSTTVEETTGFPPGGVSPVGLLTPLPVYVDKSLYQYDVVYAAAGTANSVLPVSPARLQEVIGAEVVDACN